MAIANYCAYLCNQVTYPKIGVVFLRVVAYSFDNNDHQQAKDIAISQRSLSIIILVVALIASAFYACHYQMFILIEIEVQQASYAVMNDIVEMNIQKDAVERDQALVISLYGVGDSNVNWFYYVEDHGLASIVAIYYTNFYDLNHVDI